MDFKEWLTVASLIIATIALWRNLKADNKNDGAQISEILVKMEIMGSDLKEIKSDFKAEVKTIKADQEALKDRVLVLEQSTKSAHKRLDALHEAGE